MPVHPLGGMVVFTTADEAHRLSLSTSADAAGKPLSVPTEGRLPQYEAYLKCVRDTCTAVGHTYPSDASPFLLPVRKPLLLQPEPDGGAFVHLCSPLPSSPSMQTACFFLDYNTVYQSQPLDRQTTELEDGPQETTILASVLQRWRGVERLVPLSRNDDEKGCLSTSTSKCTPVVYVVVLTEADLERTACTGVNLDLPSLIDESQCSLSCDLAGSTDHRFRVHCYPPELSIHPDECAQSGDRGSADPFPRFPPWICAPFSGEAVRRVSCQVDFYLVSSAFIHHSVYFQRWCVPLDFPYYFPEPFLRACAPVSITGQSTCKSMDRLVEYVLSAGEYGGGSAQLYPVLTTFLQQAAEARPSHSLSVGKRRSRVDVPVEEDLFADHSPRCDEVGWDWEAIIRRGWRFALLPPPCNRAAVLLETVKQLVDGRYVQQVREYRGHTPAAGDPSLKIGAVEHAPFTTLQLWEYYLQVALQSRLLPETRPIFPISRESTPLIDVSAAATNIRRWLAHMPEAVQRTCCFNREWLWCAVKSPDVPLRTLHSAKVRDGMKAHVTGDCCGAEVTSGAVESSELADLAEVLLARDFWGGISTPGRDFTFTPAALGLPDDMLGAHLSASVAQFFKAPCASPYDQGFNDALPFSHSSLEGRRLSRIHSVVYLVVQSHRREVQQLLNHLVRLLGPYPNDYVREAETLQCGPSADALWSLLSPSMTSFWERVATEVNEALLAKPADTHPGCMDERISSVEVFSPTVNLKTNRQSILHGHPSRVPIPNENATEPTLPLVGHRAMLLFLQVMGASQNSDTDTSPAPTTECSTTWHPVWVHHAVFLLAYGLADCASGPSAHPTPMPKLHATHRSSRYSPLQKQMQKDVLTFRALRAHRLRLDEALTAAYHAFVDRLRDAM